MKKYLLLIFLLPLILDAQDIEWARFINGAGGEFFHAIAADAEGNVYGGGAFEGTMSIDGEIYLALGSADGFLFKMSPEGEMLWHITMGGISTSRVSDIQFDDNGNLLVSGYFNQELLFGDELLLTADEIDWNAFMLWITPEGALQQSAQIPCSRLLQTRGFFQAKDGGYYLAGNFRGELEYGGATLENRNDYMDLFLLKLSPELNVVWHKHFEADDIADVEEITEGPDEGIFLTARYTGRLALGGITLDAGATTGSDGAVFKFDRFGQLQWHQVVRGQGPTAFNSISTGPYGDVYLTGVFTQDITLDFFNAAPEESSNLFICKLRGNNGIPLWLYTYAHESYNAGACIRASPAGGFWLSGQYGGDFNLGGILLPGGGEPAEGFLAKFDDDGAAAWAQTINGPADDWMGRFAVHPDGPLYGIATFRNSTQIGSFPGNAQDETDIAAFKVGCPVNKPVVSQDGNILFTTENYALYQWYKDGRPIPGNGAAAIAEGTGQYQVAVESFTGCVTISEPIDVMVSTEETTRDHAVKVHPNPAREVLFVELPALPEGKGRMRLSHPTGEAVMERLIDSPRQSVSLSGLPSGVYILEVFSGNVRWVKRIIH